MKTLVIISHPEITSSSSQQFLMASSKELEDVTVHHIESHYSLGKIDQAKEQELIAEHQRIIFQFPLYWYSTPSLLKEWQDVVLQKNKAELWQDKELGLVVTVGVAAKEYQAGGREQFSLAELLRPFQAVANVFSWHYLPIFSVHQFDYLPDPAKQKLLVAYQQYLMLGQQTSLQRRTQWFSEQLEKINTTKKDEQLQHRINLVKESIQKKAEEIEELTLAVKELGEW